MPRNSATVEPDVEVDVPEDETDAPTETPAAATEEKATKAKSNPRWTPPEGYVTLAGFAKTATERKLHTPRGTSEPVEVKSQMIYSYEKNSPKTDKFPTVYFEEGKSEPVGSAREDGPGETLSADQAKERGLKQAVKIEDGVAWFERKNKRVSEKSANAAAKAAAKTEKGQSAPEAAVEAVVEVEDDDSADATEAE
jgi:hypothetical protein